MCVKLWNIFQTKRTFSFGSDTCSAYQVLRAHCIILNSDSTTLRLFLGYLKVGSKSQVAAPKKTSGALGDQQPHLQNGEDKTLPRGIFTAFQKCGLR